jgi:hypothetical protein
VHSEKLRLSAYSEIILITFGTGRRGLVKIAGKLPVIKIGSFANAVKWVTAIPTISYGMVS